MNQKKFRFKRFEVPKDKHQDMPVEAGHRPNWRERAMFGHISNNHPFNYLYPFFFLARIIIFVAMIVFIHKDGFV